MLSKSSIVAVLIGTFCWEQTDPLHAQTFMTLYNFSPTPTRFSPNNDGARPFAPLVVSGNTLYGTARYGGSAGRGAVFSIDSDGSNFTNLHSFTFNDGAQPASAVLFLADTLYGTAQVGGNSGTVGSGTLFAISIHGTAFTNLYFFSAVYASLYTNADGAQPAGTLVMQDGTLYGTTVTGGTSGSGTVFAISTDGAGFTNLHSFVSSTDGAQPHAGLLLSGDTLFGTTFSGGSAGNGTIFCIKTNGTDFATLHTFSAASGSLQTNSDGMNPAASLILSGTNLFGAAQIGGRYGAGTLFRMSLDGTVFETLHNFSAVINNTNIDGAEPHTGLILSANTLYGIAGFGGLYGNGTVFSVQMDGSGFATLHNFTGPFGHGDIVTNSDGSLPSGLVLLNGRLFGTAQFGGSAGNGTIFSISLLPELTITLSGANVILTWHTNGSGYTLQTSTNLDSLGWATNSAPPLVIDGQNTVTNPLTSGPLFFRLSR